MDRRNTSPLRALPRLFLDWDGEAPIELPKAEYEKLTKVLRLQSGAQVLVLPGDGSGFRCELKGRSAIPLEIVTISTESPINLILAQALPKADKVDEVIRLCTELGVAEFVLFPSDRTVVQWDSAKRDQKLVRFNAIAREAAEVAFRSKLPKITFTQNLEAVLAQFPQAQVCSESETILTPINKDQGSNPCVVIGPEGGWSPRETQLISDRAVSLGPRVFRVDTAACAACALMLLGSGYPESSHAK